MPRKLWTLPRSLPIATVVPSKFWDATAPRQQMNSGRIRSSCRSKIAAAIGKLGRQRVAISGRPAFEHVQDVDVFALDPARFDDLVEQLPATADERLAQSIFVRPRRFAKKAQPRIRIADAEYGLRSRAGQLRAARATGDLLLDHVQRQVGRSDSAPILRPPQTAMSPSSRC